MQNPLRPSEPSIYSGISTPSVYTAESSSGYSGSNSAVASSGDNGGYYAYVWGFGRNHDDNGGQHFYVSNVVYIAGRIGSYEFKANCAPYQKRFSAQVTRQYDDLVTSLEASVDIGSGPREEDAEAAQAEFIRDHRDGLRFVHISP